MAITPRAGVAPSLLRMAGPAQGLQVGQAIEFRVGTALHRLDVVNEARGHVQALFLARSAQRALREDALAALRPAVAVAALGCRLAAGL